MSTAKAKKKSPVKKRVVRMFKPAEYRALEEALKREAYQAREDHPALLAVWERKRLLRYWCFRMQTQVTGGCKAEGDTLPDGFYTAIEKTLGFTSWEDFGTLWDLHPAKPDVIVHRTSSIWKEHNDMLAATVPVLPSMLHDHDGDTPSDRIVKRAARQILAAQK